MDKKVEMITLETLGGGAASEMFSGSLEKLIENVVNPNTKPETMRSITLCMKVKPDKKQRTLCVVELSCVEKLAPIVPFETAMFVGMENGVAASTEYSPQQGQLFTGEQEGKNESKVIAMGGRK